MIDERKGKKKKKSTCSSAVEINIPRLSLKFRSIDSFKQEISPQDLQPENKKKGNVTYII